MIRNLRILGSARSGTTLLWILLLQNLGTMGIYQPSTTRAGILSSKNAKSPLSFKQDRFFSIAYQFLLGSWDNSQLDEDVQDFLYGNRNLAKKVWISKDIMRADQSYHYQLFEPKVRCDEDEIFNVFLFRHPFNFVSSWNKEFTKGGISQSMLDAQVSAYKRFWDIVSRYTDLDTRNFLVIEFEAFTQEPEYFLEKINRKSNLELSYNRRDYSKKKLGERVLFGNQLHRKLVLGYKALASPTYHSVNHHSQVFPIYSKARLEKPFHIEAAQSLLYSYEKFQEISLSLSP